MRLDNKNRQDQKATMPVTIDWIRVYPPT